MILSSWRVAIPRFPLPLSRAYTTESVVSALKKSLEAPNLAEGVAEPGLRILIFGKPGSGKGTLSARLVQKYDLSFVASGDVLRREIMNGTSVGKVARKIVADGGLLPDDLMLKIVMSELNQLHGKSWILDGFPRTLEQGEMLNQALAAQNRPFNMIIHLAVPDSVIMKRISARWVHLPSGRVYNDDFGSSAPKVPGRDDVTGERLSRRPDDNPETFAKRLNTYHETTSPLLHFFAERYPGSLHSLAGATSDEVNAASLPAPQYPATFSYNHPEQEEWNLTQAPPGNDLSQIWPQLQELIDPYGIERQEGSLYPDEVELVKQEADDLKVAAVGTK